MRSRNIKPDYFRNEHLLACTPWARIMFLGLIALADREGRLLDRPRQIKIKVFPCDECDVEALIDELATQRESDGSPALIERYFVDGGRYIRIVNFLKHQNPHRREAQSIIPPPPIRTAIPMPENGADKQPQPKTKTKESPVHHDLSRYNAIQQVKIQKCFDGLALTRRNGQMSPNVISAELERWSKLPVERVMYAVEKYLAGGYWTDGKNERYLWGIMRHASQGEIESNGTRGVVPTGKASIQGRDDDALTRHNEAVAREWLRKMQLEMSDESK